MAKATKAVQLKTRDYLMIRVICGATKAAVHIDLKRKRNRRECREWKRRVEQW